MCLCRIYVGKEWPSLSANPSNDLRDMANILHRYIFLIIPHLCQ
jgi:hypothetical protein